MFFTETKDGYILRIRVTPNASKCGSNGVFVDAKGEEYLKVSLNAVPEKGKANEELIKFLGKCLKVGKSSFTIVCGMTDRYKQIYFSVEPSEAYFSKLSALEKGI